jgi:hypothetical protein
MNSYLIKLGIGVVGTLVSSASLLFYMMKIAGNKFINNEVCPFTTAINNTRSSGYILADFLIDNFSDRFINLIGFSLGTMVIYYCL